MTAPMILLAAGAACALALLLLLLLGRLAERLGLVDRPGGRRDHAGTVPLTGGVAIVGAAALVLALVPPASLAFAPLLAGMTALLLLGLADDVLELPAGVQLPVQLLLVGACVVGGGVLVPALGDLFGGGAIALGAWAVPFTVLALVALLNAINMIDGLDGLAGGVAVVMLGWFLVIAALVGAPGVFLVAAVLAGALLGFLCLNFPGFGLRPAQVFLGDAGSMAVGLALGWLAADLAFVRGADVPPMVLAWVLAVPVLDMGVVILRRLARRRSPLAADREHVHHYLLWLGCSRRAATWLLIAATAVTGALGVGAWLLGVPEWLLFVGFVLLGVGHLVLMEVVLPRLRGSLRGDGVSPPFS